MGICHGWAPAAFSVKRPNNHFNLTAADGKTKVFFWADDVRGLSCLKWASSEFSTAFLGGRCNKNEGSIETDEETGLVIDDECFDVNPGAWHIILSNELGTNKKSFVIDATWDY